MWFLSPQSRLVFGGCPFLCYLSLAVKQSWRRNVRYFQSLTRLCVCIIVCLCVVWGGSAGRSVSAHPKHCSSMMPPNTHKGSFVQHSTVIHFPLRDVGFPNAFLQFCLFFPLFQSSHTNAYTQTHTCNSGTHTHTQTDWTKLEKIITIWILISFQGLKVCRFGKWGKY